MASPSIWKTNKRLGIIICVILISCLAVGSTLAYIVAKTDLLQNIFSPSEVSITVDGRTVTNTGDTDAYVRMIAVVALRSISDPDVYHGTPFVWGKDYTGSYPSTGEWQLNNSDGYFYYPTPIAPNGTVEVPALNIQVEPDFTIPDGYKVYVQYLVTGIQANPTIAVVNSWNVIVDGDGKITGFN